MNFNLPAQAALVVAFTIQVLVVTACCSVILAAAVALAEVVHYIDGREAVPDIVVLAGKGVEHVLLFVDMIVFLAFVLAEAASFLRTIWRHFREAIRDGRD